MTKIVFLLSKQKNIIMKIIFQPIKRSELKAMLPGYFGDMIKAVVDVQKAIIGLDAELHADIEQSCFSKAQNKPICGESTFTPKWEVRTLLNSTRSSTFVPIKAIVAVMFKTPLFTNVLLKS